MAWDDRHNVKHGRSQLSVLVARGVALTQGRRGAAFGISFVLMLSLLYMYRKMTLPRKFFYLREICFIIIARNELKEKQMKKLEVVAAIIIYEDRILCMQRGDGKFAYVSRKYEFPGGKIEAGETQAEALMRELREEMALEVTIKDEDHFMTVNHVYPDFEITMHSFICHVQTQQFVRKEHIDHKWLKKEDLMTLDWAPADIPIAEKLQQTL